MHGGSGGASSVNQSISGLCKQCDASSIVFRDLWRGPARRRLCAAWWCGAPAQTCTQLNRTACTRYWHLHACAHTAYWIVNRSLLVQRTGWECSGWRAATDSRVLNHARTHGCPVPPHGSAAQPCLRRLHFTLFHTRIVSRLLEATARHSQPLQDGLRLVATMCTNLAAARKNEEQGKTAWPKGSRSKHPLFHLAAARSIATRARALASSTTRSSFLRSSARSSSTRADSALTPSPPSCPFRSMPLPKSNRTTWGLPRLMSIDMLRHARSPCSRPQSCRRCTCARRSCSTTSGAGRRYAARTRSMRIHATPLCTHPGVCADIIDIRSHNFGEYGFLLRTYGVLRAPPGVWSTHFQAPCS